MVLTMIGIGWLAAPSRAAAQSAPSPPRPWGRVSFYSNVSQTEADGGASSGFGEFITSVTFQLPERANDGVEYGLDLRQAAYSVSTRP